MLENTSMEKLSMPARHSWQMASSKSAFMVGMAFGFQLGSGALFLLLHSLGAGMPVIIVFTVIYAIAALILPSVFLLTFEKSCHLINSCSATYLFWFALLITSLGWIVAIYTLSNPDTVTPKKERVSLNAAWALSFMTNFAHLR